MPDTGERPTDDSPLMVSMGAHRRYALIAAWCRGSSILDIGCGSCGLWPYVSPWATRYQGLEKMVMPTHKSFTDDPRASFHAVTDLIGWLKERGTQADTTVAIEVIEHLDPAGQQAFIATMWQNTAKRMILTTPHPDASRYYPFTDHFVGTQNNPYHTRELHPFKLAGYIAKSCAEPTAVQFLWCSLEHDDEQVWSTSPVRPPMGYAVIVDR